MKKLPLVLITLFCVARGYAAPIPADDILAFVRSKLPDDPFRMTGTLSLISKNGFKTTLPVEISLDWGAETPEAKYKIDNESLTIRWNNDQPSYAFSNTKNTPTTEILGTGITWADLSFSVLWWPNSRLTGEGEKFNRDCYIVDVPVPDSQKTMRLWVEKNMGMLLEARFFDSEMNEIRSLKVDSIKKMDGMWIAKDLVVREKKTGSKTTLQISDLEWTNPKPSAEAFDPAASVNELAYDLYHKLAGQNDGDLFFSPYSISSALAMTYGGARGETAEQMEEVLHFGMPATTHPAFSYLRETLNNIQGKEHVQLSVANALWPQKDYAFLPEYLALSRKYYGCEITPVDYKADTEAARNLINSWVEDQTNSKIKDLIAEGFLSAQTRLVLANAIYFKGDWASQFKQEATRPAPFTLTDGATTDVPMMSQTADFKLARTETVQALELPYEGGELSMIILLPNPGEEPVLTSLDDLEFREMEVMVQLPKFKVETEFYLGKTLSALGMPLAFTRGADFSGMDGSRNLSIDEVIHKAFIEVNEEGTEAAAATAVGIRATSMPPQFIADHPFLFLIRENATGTILFIGRITDPR